MAQVFRYIILCVFILQFGLICNAKPRIIGTFINGIKETIGDIAGGISDIKTGVLENIEKYASMFTAPIEKLYKQYEKKADIFVNASEVQFFLYTSLTNVTERCEIIMDDLESVSNCGYRTDLSLIVITHGFMGDTVMEDGNGATELRNGYFEGGYFGVKANVILVDWSKMSGPKRLLPKVVGLFPAYVQSATNVYIAADKVSDFLQFMVMNKLVPGNGDGIHLVGHSLGAHVLGVAARNYKKYNNKDVIGRLSGTDPAGPLFQRREPDRRFDSAHAKFVDAIHTNQYGFGFINSLAHVDYYVNGAVIQPSCIDITSDTEKSIGCSHQQAPKYWAASVVDQTNVGTCYTKRSGKCSDKTVIFGQGNKPGTTGPYYVEMKL